MKGFALASLLAAICLLACAHAPRDDRPQLEQAGEWVRRGEPNRALPILAELEQRAPDSLDVARLKAEAYARLGRARELIEELASRPRPTAADHYLRALLLGAAGEDPQSAARARAELEAAIDLAPEKGELHYRLGLALLIENRPADAVAALRRALELDAARTAPYLPLAKGLLQLARAQEALSALKEWASRRPPPAELDAAERLMDELAPPLAGLPTEAQPKLLAGVAVLEVKDDPVAAIAVLAQLARDHPRVGVIHTALALCHRRLDEAARAIQELREAIVCAPADGRNYQYLGEIYLERQQRAQAKRAFADAAKLNPLLEIPQLALAQLAMDEGDAPAAQRHLSLAAAIARSLEVRAKLAAIFESTHRYDEALAQLGEIQRRQPDEATWAFRLGMLHLRKYREEAAGAQRERCKAQAIHWLKEGLRLQSDNVSAAEALRSLDAS